MKSICRMALFLLLASAAGNIWAADWGPAGRGPIGVTANFGLGRLTGEGKSKGQEIKDLRVDPIRLGVGASYAHPLSEMFALGGFAEMRLSFTRLRYNFKQPGFKKEFDDAGSVGFGFAVGPYFRLALWGADKKGGLAFAPYFALQSLRGAKTDKHSFRGGSKSELKHEAILAAGGGLRVDVFINKLIGINLGLELLGSQFQLKFGNTNYEWPLFGAVAYAGVTLSF